MRARCRFFRGDDRVWVDCDPDGKITDRGTYEGSPSIGVLSFLLTLDRERLLQIIHSNPLAPGSSGTKDEWNAFVYYLE